MISKKDATIAVIGSGAAGLTAAYLLSREYRVTLFERNEYFGGHVHTVVVPEGPRISTPIDTAFMVYHERGYPLFLRLLDQLGIKGKHTEMSFSFTRLGRKHGRSIKIPGGWFVQKKNWFQPSFYRLLFDVRRFNRNVVTDFQKGKLKSLAIGEYLDMLRLSRSFADDYLAPLKAAIWSMPQSKILDYPAESFVRFLLRYGLVGPRRREYWMHIPGGSHCYVNAILNRFKGELKKKTEIEAVRRTNEKVIVKEKHGFESVYDNVIIACHADEALRLLEDPSAEERRLLSPWSYVKSQVVLHTDETLMPAERAAWASWNCICDESHPESVSSSLTCSMNHLQKLKTKYRYFVTINAHKPIDRNKVIKEMEYAHPVFSFECLRLQPEMHKLNAPERRTFYCGSYFGAGFHEDAIKSALDAISPFCLTL